MAVYISKIFYGKGLVICLFQWLCMPQSLFISKPITNHKNDNREEAAHISETFERLVRDHERAVYNHAYRMLGNEYDAFDISQEAFLSAYSNFSKFKNNSSFSTWIYRIVHNLCLDELRKRKSSKKTVTLNDDYLKNTLTDGSSPVQAAENAESAQMIQNAINNLPAKMKEVIVFRDIDGLSYDEISKILRCSAGTVKSRINRARNKLKKLLEQKL